MQPLLLRTGTEAQGCETGGSLVLQLSFVRTQLCMSVAASLLVFVDGGKLAASHIQGSEALQVGKAMLVKLVHKYFTHLEDDGRFAKYAIGTAIAMPFWASAVCQWLVGDVVWLHSPVRLAVVKLAVRAGSAPHSYKFAVFVSIFAQAPNGARLANGGSVAVVDVGAITTVCCHLMHGGTVYV